MALPALPTDLTDMTTRAFACEIGATCPCIHLSLMDDSYFVVGATIDHKEVPALSTRVSPHETATRLPRGLVEEAVINSILQKQRALIIFALMIQCATALMARPFRGLVRSIDPVMGSIAHAVLRR